MSEDAELLRRYVAERSEAAFADLVRRHVDLVYSTALRLVRGDTHKAEDVTQQVFIEVARQAKRLAGHPALTGWLYTTTRRTVWRLLRSDLRRVAREQEAMNQIFGESAPSQDWEQVGPVLDDAMDELAERDRIAVLLRFFKKKSLREVGEELGLTENAARMRVERALDKLRVRLESKGVRSTSTALALAISGSAVNSAPAGLAASVAGASLAGAAAETGTTLSIIKFMAATILKTAAVSVLVAGAALTVVLLNQARISADEENETLRRQLAELKAKNDGLSDQLAQWKRLRSRRLPAPGLPANPAASVDDASFTNLWDRLEAKARTITTDKLQDYLKNNHRNAESLLASFRVTHDLALLEEAKKNFPNDPNVAFEAAIYPGSSDSERTQWLAAFEKAAPDNALANYLSALNDFKTGQTDQAMAEMSAAAGKTQFQDYSLDRMQSDEEAYLAAGTSLSEAKQLSGSQLLLPQLGEIKQLGLDMVDLANSYQQSGDTASAQSALQMAMSLGQRYGDPSYPGEPAISQLVGIALEQIALKTMDANAQYGDSGQTVQDQLDQLAQERDQIQNLASQVELLLPNMSDDDWIIYRDRWLTMGEQAAMQWVIAKYGPAK